MAAIRDIHNVWRDSLVPASFRGALFHVETSGRASGRRTVLHQYPKRNEPYAEDMGREAIRWTFNGYLIHGDHGFPGNLLSQIAMLIRALETDEAGILVHPMIGTMLVMVERYSYSDSRTKGGYVEFDMSFIEAGSPATSSADAGSALDGASSQAESAGTSSINNATQSLGSADPSGGIPGFSPA